MEESLGINLYQEAKVQIGTISQIDVESGMETPFAVDIYNTGRSPVYNMMIKMYGDFDVAGDTYYIGIFQPGSTESFSAGIIGIEPGDNTGSITITYDNATGKSHEEKQEFSANIIEMNMEDMEEVEEEKTPNYKNAILWVIVAIVIIIVKKRKK